LITVVICGCIAAALMLFECLLMSWLVAIGSATGSQDGYGMLEIVMMVTVLSLVAYFPIAILRVGARKEKNGATDAA
jgi:hypothetical protein